MGINKIELCDWFTLPKILSKWFIVLDNLQKKSFSNNCFIFNFFCGKLVLNKLFNSEAKKTQQIQEK